MSAERGGDAGLHDGGTTVTTRGRQFIQEAGQFFTRVVKPIVIDQHMIGNHISSHLSDSFKPFQCFDDGPLRRLAAGT